jgi:argininosuccinate lyase
MSFRTAHEIVSKAVKDLQGRYDAAQMAAHVAQILAEQYSHLPMPEVDLLLRALRAEHFVAVRKIDGGPAPEALEPEIKRAHELVIAEQQQLQAHLDRFRNAHEQLHEETRSLLASGDVS